MNVLKISRKKRHELLNLPQRVQTLTERLRLQQARSDLLALNSYLDQRKSNHPKSFDPVAELFEQELLRPYNYFGLYPDYPIQTFAHLKYLLRDKKCKFIDTAEREVLPNLFYIWGYRGPAQDILSRALMRDLPVYFFEDPFLRSVCPSVLRDQTPDLRFIQSIGMTVDDCGCYFDCFHHSRLEMMLNDPRFDLSKEELSRARNCITTLVQNRLSKYNHQPLELPEQIKRQLDGCHKKSVLIVDQRKGDMSIYRGGIHDETYRQIITDALRENPESDIFLKAHPDMLSGKFSGCFNGTELTRLHLIDCAVNPYALLEQVDLVYTGTSQMGFEALLAGKKVICYGLPFYAGWGLTEDRLCSTYRTRRRSLEEVFYCAYIAYSHYVDPINRCRCSLERTMDYLLELREEFFALRGVRTDGF
ncbi:MAG: hypothetical protein IJ228_02005 [Succinivibrio sp.]|nr:hypothetical protein [Succinivibrio sp.]